MIHKVTNRLLLSPILLLLWLQRITCIPIDNGVEGSEVTCTSDSIMIDFTTKNPFRGRIFVKGMIDNEECVTSFADATADNAAPSVSFSFGACNMQRSRTLSPQRGMMQSIIVIISFHGIFITKVDKAYKVQCFYMEAEKAVTSNLEVSMLTTDDLRDTGRMPTCTYTVRLGSKDGEAVRYAKVGDEVYHEWECDSESHSILVKTCFVDDGQGNRFEIIDDKGCSVDPVIMGDLLYEESGNAKAWVEAHVFKFADRPNVFFQCVIQLCNRGDDACTAITPPNCPGSGSAGGQRRVRRTIELLTNNMTRTNDIEFETDEMDLISNTIKVIDLEDSDTATDQEINSIQRRLLDVPLRTIEERRRSAEEKAAICLSPTGFGTLLAIVVLVFVAAFIIAIVLCIGIGRIRIMDPKSVL